LNGDQSTPDEMCVTTSAPLGRQATPTITSFSAAALVGLGIA